MYLPISGTVGIRKRQARISDEMFKNWKIQRNNEKKGKRIEYLYILTIAILARTMFQSTSSVRH